MNDPSSPAPPELVALARQAQRIVALTGAGMSSESGIATFRDKATGLWSRLRPEDLATPAAFMRQPEVVWAWYEARRREVRAAQPNAGHRALHCLAQRPGLESLGVVTQNVDDLHERASLEVSGGARVAPLPAVLHLHGSLFAPRCFDCARPFAAPPDEAAAAPETATLPPPRCTHCGGAVRPGVVWFGETLPEATWREALAWVARADLVLVIGTSGQVYPAASLPDTARRHGARVAVINPDAGAAGHAADLHWPTTAAIGLPALARALQTA